MNIKNTRKRSNILLSLLASTCCIFIASFQICEIREIQSTINSLQEEGFTSPPELQTQLSLLKVSPSLGFRNLLANSTFLRFLQYFSDVSIQEDISQHLSPDFFDVIITFDPFYRDYYLFLSGSTTFHAAQPEKTVELMDKGLERIDPTLVSDSFYIWRYKGVDELLFLGDSESARQSFENAALWAQYSDRAESDLVGQVSQQTADFLKQDPDSRYAQIAAWRSVVENSVNEDIRKRAAQRIQELTEAEKLSQLEY